MKGLTALLLYLFLEVPAVPESRTRPAAFVAFPPVVQIVSPCSVPLKTRVRDPIVNALLRKISLHLKSEKVSLLIVLLASLLVVL